MNWKRETLVAFGAAAIVGMALGLLGARLSLDRAASIQDGQRSLAAAQQPTPMIDPQAPPVSKLKGLENPWGTGSGPDLGEGIDIRSLFGISTPTPIPTPTAGQKVWKATTKVPIFGGLAEGLWTVVMAIDWMLRHIWLVLVAAFLLAFLLRLPPWFSLLLCWEIVQTLWTRRSIEDVLRRQSGQR